MTLVASAPHVRVPFLSKMRKGVHEVNVMTGLLFDPRAKSGSCDSRFLAELPRHEPRDAVITSPSVILLAKHVILTPFRPGILDVGIGNEVGLQMVYLHWLIEDLKNS